MLDVATLDRRCAPIADALRLRGDIPEAELVAAVPSLEASADDWLSYYGQLNRWLAAAPAAGQDDHAAADRLVLDAQRNAPIPVDGTPLSVYPKSFATLVHLAELDAHLDGLVRYFAVCSADTATAAERDQLNALAFGLERAQGLILWAWTTPGVRLPWDPAKPAGEIPPEITDLLPHEVLSVHQSVGELHGRLQALAILLDPVRREQGGARPSWSGLFHAMGMELGISAREVMEGHSLEQVLAMAQLQAARNAPPEATR